MGFDRVVLWDFDGTLAVRDGRWSGCLLECLAEVEDHEVAIDDLREHVRGGFPWHQPEIGHTHIQDADSWWAALTPRFVAALSAVGVKTGTAEAASELVRTRYVEPAQWTVFPDVEPALAALRARGWHNVVLSNHVPELPELISALGLDQLIDRVFTSARVGWEKPNAKIFTAALIALGDPGQAWMVGDNPIADIAGAEAVGIPAILVRTDGHSGLDAAVTRIAEGLSSP